MRHILLITDSYPPEIRSASHLMQDLGEGLAERGYKVTVLTSYPKYNLAKEHKNRVFTEHAMENGIEVLRVKTLPHHKVDFILRGISHILMPYLFQRAVKFYIRQKIDCVIVYSPPLTLARVGIFIKRRYNAKFILNVQDIFPQNAIDLGVLRNRLLVKFFESVESNAYLNSDTILVHSKGNKQFLIDKKYVPASKVCVVNNWSDIPAHGSFAERKLSFRREFGLDNKFVFLFAGVMGPSQGLDVVLKAAEDIGHLQEISILFVGDGSEKERLANIVQQRNLKNVLFKPFVSKRDYPCLIKEADVGLVCLSSQNKTPVVPGKILGYMAASRPILAFLHKESDGHSIINEAKCGIAEVSDDYGKIRDAFIRMYEERHRCMEWGKNSFRYLQNNFDKNKCIDKIEVLF